jgi:hypothetical protein
MLKRKIIAYILLSFIVICGLWFRIEGIKNNHSFWDDEAFISSIARDIVTGKTPAIRAIGIAGSHYQPLHTLLIAISFYFFGISEFAARLPYIILGGLGVLFAYLLATKLSNRYGGLLAAFLMAFSQINLANSTQTKPFTALQTFLLIELYLITVIEDHRRKSNILNLILLFFIAFISTFIQMVGIVAWIPLFVLVVRYFSRKKLSTQIMATATLMIISFFIIKIGFNLFKFENEGPHFPFNNISYFRELFWRNYAFITLPAIIGFLYFFMKKLRLGLTFLSLILSLLILWVFVSYTHNVRYILPLFGIIFVFFGVFWTIVGEKLFNNKSSLICCVVAVIIFAGGYKIVRTPKSYYNPNEDIYGDVQIADYKTMFNLIKQKYSNFNNLAVFNDKPDAERWYLDKQADAYFQINYQDSPPKLIDKTMKYSRLEDFKKQVSKYQRGIIIVEDWHSLLPEDIKQYAKKNLKLELRVEGLPQTGEDKWPLEVYSWGF